MVIYASILDPVIPNALGNILIASVVSTPAALAIAALMVPFGAGERRQRAAIVLPNPPPGVLDAIIKGIADGVPAARRDRHRAARRRRAGDAREHDARPGCRHGTAAPMTLQRIFALPFRPLMWLIGFSWAESAVAARTDGHQDRAQRVRRLPRFRPPAAGCAVPARAADDHLRAVRLRQFRQPRHPRRRHRRDGAGAARGDRRRSACVRCCRALWRHAAAARSPG